MLGLLPGEPLSPKAPWPSLGQAECRAGWPGKRNTIFLCLRSRFAIGGPGDPSAVALNATTSSAPNGQRLHLRPVGRPAVRSPFAARAETQDQLRTGPWPSPPAGAASCHRHGRASPAEPCRPVEREVPHVKVLCDSVRIGRLGQSHQILVQMPADDDLRRGLARAGRNVSHGRFSEHGGALTAQGAVALDQDAMVGVPVPDGHAVDSGDELDLVTAGATPVSPIRRSMWAGRKLDTPMNRTRPCACSSTSALQVSA